MRILFTGASSCTGMHFVQELAHRGHSITCIFTRNFKDYHGIRKDRIQKILPFVEPVWNTRFGDEGFCTLIQKNAFETYAHHMAWTRGYGTEKYNIKQAVHNNTLHLPKVVALLRKHGAQIVLTNSVFEGMNVRCEGGHAPFEAHGIAKRETTKAFLAFKSTVPVRRFIIPNPVGTFDNIRLVEYLHSSWLRGETPHIRYPDNIRDNIPIPYLRTRYSEFIEESKLYCSPSGWVQSNQAFVQRVAHHLGKHFLYKTPCIFGPQQDSHQPIRLHNIDPMPAIQSESHFWDSLCTHYQDRFTIC